MNRKQLIEEITSSIFTLIEEGEGERADGMLAHLLIDVDAERLFQIWSDWMQGNEKRR